MIRHVYGALFGALVASLSAGCATVVTGNSNSRTTLQPESTSSAEPMAAAASHPAGGGPANAPLSGAAEDSAALPDCDWRKCEIENGPMSCADPTQACDMYRNRCVPTCSGDDCCQGVVCPEGTVCVPGLGRCGVPAGEGCYDLGTGWWSGRDVHPGRGPVPTEAARVVFEVYNDGERPVYFEATLTQPLRFDLYLQYCGRMRKLPLAENHFCPTQCPDEGPPMEVDCGQPPPIAQCLPAGERLIVTWSGREQVGLWRLCGAPPAKYCMVDRVTRPGIYTVEICTYRGVDGGRTDPNDPNRLWEATPEGAPECFRVEFEYPGAAPVEIHLGRD